MKKWILPTLTLSVMGSICSPSFVHAQDSLAHEEAISGKIKENPEWATALKKQHHLGDEHIQFLQDQGLSYPEIALVSALSEKSGKTVEDILDMKNKDKMDWEKISKELEVSPAEVSRSIASVRQEVEAEKRNPKKEAQREDETPKRGIVKKRG